jgi:TetR/AcrR family transcriptional regulator, lmrAB and yxaGH operons repressor
MPARPKHRDAIVDSAIKLFRLRGYSATGLNDIVDESRAPKGSLYHYFPKGKASIAEAAVTVASRRIGEAMTRLSEQNTSAAGLVRAWGELLAKWMAGSNFRAGSPVTTTLLELAPDELAVTKAGRKAFANWRRIVSDKLVGDGVTAAQADRLAALVIASFEGGLIQCRVEARPDILLTIARELESLLGTVGTSVRKA